MRVSRLESRGKEKEEASHANLEVNENERHAREMVVTWVNA